MGCTQSKIENEEAVLRCKDRRQLMAQAVSFRNAFAAAQSAYAMALKNTGAALSDYGQGEVQEPHPAASSSSASATAAVAQSPMDKLPPPPPPPPPHDFSPSPIQRSASMPDLGIPKPKKLPVDPTIREEEEDADTLDDGRHQARRPSPPGEQPSSTPPPPMPESRGMDGTWDYFFEMDPNLPGPSLSQPEEILPQRKDFEEVRFKKPFAYPSVSSSDDVTDADEPPMTPEKVVNHPPPPPPPLPQHPKQVKKQKPGGPVHHQQTASAGGGTSSESKRGKMVAVAAPSVSLLQILNELDDHFLKASESAHEVSKMLEATRMHYHSNFADNRGHIDHSARVMRVITWNRSIKGLANTDDGRDDLDDDQWETHATVLDKMLAWERKLYDEVKAGELMKIEYQRKVSLLNKQKKRGTNPEALEKTKAAVSHLHTRYIVDMQSMDSTVLEINRLRDDRLYKRLVQLVCGMASMWETMYEHHDSQLKFVADLSAFDTSNAPKETTQQHYERTVQLWQLVKQWHSQFEKLVSHQKDYIQALCNWLKLNLIPLESSLKERVSSPPRIYQPPIQAVLLAWHDELGKLPNELAKNAIFIFLEVINGIKVQQEEELRQKGKCEEIHKEYARKTRVFEYWYQKYCEKRAAVSEGNDAEGNEGETQKDLVAEKKLVLETLKSKLEDEMETHQKLCRQVREKSLGSLKTHLPELFRTMSDFARECSKMYKKLQSITQPAESSE